MDEIGHTALIQAWKTSDTGTRLRNTMYDVVYIDSHGCETRVAEHLADCSDAKEIARAAAAERGVGRMMLTGSRRPSNCVCVVTTPGEVPHAA